MKYTRLSILTVSGFWITMFKFILFLSPWLTRVSQLHNYTAPSRLFFLFLRYKVRDREMEKEAGRKRDVTALFYHLLSSILAWCSHVAGNFFVKQSTHSIRWANSHFLKHIFLFSKFTLISFITFTITKTKSFSKTQ